MFVLLAAPPGGSAIVTCRHSVTVCHATRQRSSLGERYFGLSSRPCASNCWTSSGPRKRRCLQRRGPWSSHISQGIVSWEDFTNALMCVTYCKISINSHFMYVYVCIVVEELLCLLSMFILKKNIIF